MEWPNFRSFFKIGLLCLSMLGWHKLYAIDCNDEDLRTSYQELKEVVDANRPTYALNLSDSLLQVLNKEGLNRCSLFYWIQYEKGEAFELLGSKEKALDTYYPLVKKAEASRNWELAAQTYISIARTHEELGRGEDCRRNLKDAKEIIDQHNLNAVFARYAVRYSSFSRFFGNRDTAMVYAALAIEYGKRYKVQRSELDGHLLLGLISQDFDESIFHLEETIKIFEDRKDYNGAAWQKLNIAERYFSNNRLESSMLHADTALMYAQKNVESTYTEQSVFSYIYDLKRRYFLTQDRLDSAYYYSEQSRKIDREIDIQNNQEAISQKEIAFAIEREQEKLQYERQQAIYLRWGIFSMGGLLAVLILVLINNEYKRRLIAEQKNLISSQYVDLEAALRAQSLLLSEINHRVKNNLQLVVSLLTIRGQKASEPTVQFHLDDLSKKVQSIALIHEQLYRSGEFETINLKNYFSELTTHFSTIQDRDYPISFQVEAGQLELNLETVLPLGIICTELISNSIKYAPVKGKELIIQVRIEKQEDQYSFIYQDNGPGYPKGKLLNSSKGMGSMLIYSMVRQLKGDSKSGNDNGATFTLFFKEKQVSQV